MLIRALYAFVVGIIAIIVCVLLGSLLVTIEQETIKQLGTFLKTYAGLIGILCGLVYFVTGLPQLRRG